LTVEDTMKPIKNIADMKEAAVDAREKGAIIEGEVLEVLADIATDIVSAAKKIS